MADSRDEEGEIQDAPGTCSHAENKEMLKKIMGENVQRMQKPA